MASPVLKTCLKDVWTIVASNITSCLINIVDTNSRYFYTYRDFADSASILTGEELPIPPSGINLVKEQATDVYVLCKTKNGVVRVDGQVKRDPQNIPITFTEQGRMEIPFLINKGQLNKLRLRPQILNEHVESSREVQAVIDENTIVNQIFLASSDNINSIFLNLESAASVVVDNFNEYLNNAELQAAWVASGANLASLELVIVKSGQSMTLPTQFNGDEWALDLGDPVDMTGFTGSLDLYQEETYAKQKMRVFIGDGTNTKSIALATSGVNNWNSFDIPIGALSEDGGGTTDETAIITIGFRVESKSVGDNVFIDDIFYTPPPGKARLKLYDMGENIPVPDVTKLSDGTLYESLGDLSEGPGASSFLFDLQGGQRGYHLDDMIAGVALEIPGNELLNVGHYYVLSLSYVDTDVSVYGPDTSFETNYYQNGYAFTAPDEDTQISAIGEFSDLSFGVLSTQDVYVLEISTRYDDVPGDDSEFRIKVEDENMGIMNLIQVHSHRPDQSNVLNLRTRPPFLGKGGKLEHYHGDDSNDDVSLALFAMTYVYQKIIPNG